MGSIDKAGICEIVGIFLLYKLNDLIDPFNHGLYRDNGLILLERGTARIGDMLRKKVIKMFKEYDVDIDIESNLKIVEYLDITLNLNNGIVAPFKKANHIPSYINTASNHPRQIYKNISKGIATRLSNNSSNKNIFEQNIDEYQQALRKSGYNTLSLYKHNSSGHPLSTL